MRSPPARDNTSACKLVKAELGNSRKGGEADVAGGGSMCRQDVLAGAKFFLTMKEKIEARLAFCAVRRVSTNS